MSAHGFLHLDVILIESLTEGLIEIDARVNVGCHGLHFQILIGRKILLGLNDGGDVRPGGSVLEALLLRLQALFGQNTRVDGGFITHARLLQADDGVLDVDANLIERALQLQLFGAQL